MAARKKRPPPGPELVAAVVALAMIGAYEPRRAAAERRVVREGIRLLNGGKRKPASWLSDQVSARFPEAPQPAPLPPCPTPELFPFI